MSEPTKEQGNEPEATEAAKEEELEETALDDPLLGALASLKTTAAAPPELGSDVAERIRKRSAGRFFGDRSLGDRKFIGVLAIVILALILGLYWLMRDSETGSLKLDQGQEVPSLAPGARDVVPQP